MTSIDVDNLALRKITAYNSDNTFVSTNRVFTVGNNGNVNWSDSLSLSSLVTSSIAASTITTTNLLVNGSTMIGPQGIAMYSNVTSSFTDNITTQGEKLYFNGQEVQTGGSGNNYWDEVSGKGWIVNSNLGDSEGNYYLVGIGTSTLTATLDVSGSIHASTINTNLINPTGTILTITNNTVVQKSANDVNFEISNTNVSTCQPDQPVTASLTLRTMNGAYTLFNSRCTGQGLTENNLTLYSYFGADTNIFNIDPSGNIDFFANINANSTIRLISPDDNTFGTISEANEGHLDISSALIVITSPDGVQIKPTSQNTGSGTITLFNGNTSSKPVYFTTYASGNSSGGLTTGNLQLYGYSGSGYSTIRSCVDITPEGDSIILGDDNISGGCVVSVNGTSGLGRVYDTIYNPPTNGSSSFTYSGGGLTSPQLNINLNTNTLFQQYLVNATNQPITFNMPTFNDSENGLIISVTCMSGRWNGDSTTLGIYMDLSSNTTVYSGGNQGSSNIMVIESTSAFSNNYFNFTISDVFTNLPTTGTQLSIRVWIQGVDSGKQLSYSPCTVTISTATLLN